MIADTPNAASSATPSIPASVAVVEVVGGEKTGSAAIERALAFYTAIGKQPTHVQREVPGYVANRLQAALWREALHLEPALIIVSRNVWTPRATAGHDSTEDHLPRKFTCDVAVNETWVRVIRTLAIGKSGASAGPSGAERRLDALDRDGAVPRMRKERASCSFDQGATAEPVSQLSAAGLWPRELQDRRQCCRFLVHRQGTPGHRLEGKEPQKS